MLITQKRETQKQCPVFGKIYPGVGLAGERERLSDLYGGTAQESSHLRVAMMERKEMGTAPLREVCGRKRALSPFYHFLENSG